MANNLIYHDETIANNDRNL